MQKRAEEGVEGCKRGLRRGWMGCKRGPRKGWRGPRRWPESHCNNCILIP